MLNQNNWMHFYFSNLLSGPCRPDEHSGMLMSVFVRNSICFGLEDFETDIRKLHFFFFLGLLYVITFSYLSWSFEG